MGALSLEKTVDEFHGKSPILQEAEAARPFLPIARPVGAEFPFHHAGHLCQPIFLGIAVEKLPDERIGDAPLPQRLPNVQGAEAFFQTRRPIAFRHAGIAEQIAFPEALQQGFDLI